MNEQTKFELDNRIVEDLLGASIGSAIGVGASILLTFMSPIDTFIVPIGLMVGSLIGLLLKEIKHRKQSSTNVDSEKSS